MNMSGILKRKNAHNIIPNSGLRDLYCTEISFRSHTPAQSLKPMRKSYFCFHFILRGTEVIHTANGDFTVPEDYVWTRFPQETVSAESPDIESLSYAYISFMGMQADKVLSQLGITPENRVFPAGKEMTDLILKAVFDCKKHSEAREFIANAAIFSLLAMLAKEHNTSGVQRPVSPYVETALNYIDKHFDSYELDAKEVADYVNLNTDYFLRIFKTEMKTSFSDYLIFKRMNTAFSLVETRFDLSISDIAEAVGYSSAAYFTYAFHKAFGLSPTQYRHEIRSAGPNNGD